MISLQHTCRWKGTQERKSHKTKLWHSSMNVNVDYQDAMKIKWHQMNWNIHLGFSHHWNHGFTCSPNSLWISFSNCWSSVLIKQLLKLLCSCLVITVQGTCSHFHKCLQSFQPNCYVYLPCSLMYLHVYNFAALSTLPLDALWEV